VPAEPRNGCAASGRLGRTPLTHDRYAERYADRLLQSLFRDIAESCNAAAA
jgi:hypothetical protein